MPVLSLLRWSLVIGQQEHDVIDQQELTELELAYSYAQVLPWLAGLAEKMLLDNFQSH